MRTLTGLSGEYVTFDQNVKNAISAEFGILTEGPPYTFNYFIVSFLFQSRAVFTFVISGLLSYLSQLDPLAQQLFFCFFVQPGAHQDRLPFRSLPSPASRVMRTSAALRLQRNSRLQSANADCSSLRRIQELLLCSRWYSRNAQPLSVLHSSPFL